MSSGTSEDSEDHKLLFAKVFRHWALDSLRDIALNSLDKQGNEK